MPPVGSVAEEDLLHELRSSNFPRKKVDPWGGYIGDWVEIPVSPVVARALEPYRRPGDFGWEYALLRLLLRVDTEELGMNLENARADISLAKEAAKRTRAGILKAWKRACAVSGKSESMSIREEGTVEHIASIINGDRDQKTTPGEAAGRAIDWIVARHPFMDGNHRAALVVGAAILRADRCDINMTDQDMVAFLKSINAEELNQEDVVDRIRKALIQSKGSPKIQGDGLSTENIEWATHRWRRALKLLA
jgi:prophage maintenance system killer protein